MIKVLLPLIFVFIASVACQKSHKEACSKTNACNGDLVCKNSACKCPVGSIWSSTDKQCTPMSNGTCSSNADCQDMDKYRICKKDKCICEVVPPGEYVPRPGNWCPKRHGDACNGHAECGGDFICNDRSKTCRCRPNRLPIGFWHCANFTVASCQKDTDCQDNDANRVCSTNTKKCVCKTSFRPGKGDVCKQAHLVPCNQNNRTQCGYNDFKCDLTKGVCDCQKGFKESPDENKCVCDPKGNTCQCDGTICRSSRQGTCIGDVNCGPMMYCKPRKDQPHVCVCRIGYQWSSHYKECRLFNTMSCKEDKECQDLDTNRQCNNMTCVCKSGFYENGMYECKKTDKGKGLESD